MQYSSYSLYLSIFYYQLFIAITVFFNYLYFHHCCVTILRQIHGPLSQYITWSVFFLVGCWLVEIWILLRQTCTSIPWGTEQHLYLLPLDGVKFGKSMEIRGGLVLTFHYEMILIFKYLSKCLWILENRKLGINLINHLKVTINYSDSYITVSLEK